MRKKIVMYFRKQKKTNDHFAAFGLKRSVYHYFFKYGKKIGFDMYVASGKENYLGGMRFKNPFFYDGDCFVRKNEIIVADAVYDKSGGLAFPSRKIDRKVLNCREFKILCSDKNAMYKILGKFMPKSFSVKNTQDLQKKLRAFKKESLVVLKPANGLGGKKIVISTVAKVSKIILPENHAYVLQEFVDTSQGIKGLIKGSHDLRIVIVGRKIILSHIRCPKKGSLLANVAQGGSIQELPINKILSRVLKITREVQKVIDKKYHSPLYSIDFGLCNNKPYIFELNDQIGFPSEKMKNAKAFIRETIHSLKKLTEIK